MPGHGIDTSGMDRTLKPGNDFYSYANGGWMKATEIPADRSRWGVFSVLAEEAARRTRGDTKMLGIGVASYLEISAPLTFNREYGKVEIEEDGTRASASCR